MGLLMSGLAYYLSPWAGGGQGSWVLLMAWRGPWNVHEWSLRLDWLLTAMPCLLCSWRANSGRWLCLGGGKVPVLVSFWLPHELPEAINLQWEKVYLAQFVGSNSRSTILLFWSLMKAKDCNGRSTYQRKQNDWLHHELWGVWGLGEIETGQGSTIPFEDTLQWHKDLPLGPTL